MSYKTRQSSYGEARGCMAGTREKILAGLEAWAFDESSSRVYWLVGMAGTGKSTISHTFCEILDYKNMLGASFFCSRTGEKTRNAGVIIPAVAYSLARVSPHIKSEVLKAITEDPALAESNYNNMNEQFSKLVSQPIRMSVDPDVKIYKVVVIDALDETEGRKAASLIEVILNSASGIPLKFFIASRDEGPIRKAFHRVPAAKRGDAFYLHEVEKEIVGEDIEKYVKKSLADMLETDGVPSDAWPSQDDLSILLLSCGTLFIYAATIMRYIDDENGNYRDRLSAIIHSSGRSSSRLQTAEIDYLYGQILERACDPRLNEPPEVKRMTQTLATIVFAQTPLSIQAITSLLGMDVSPSLSAMKSLIHVPSANHKMTTVTVFHASFAEFVTDTTRCSGERCPSFHALAASEEHATLALRCLELMIRSLKRNICGVPEALTVSRRDRTNSQHDTTKIPEALRYACLYWALHFSKGQDPRQDVLDALRTFLQNHLLHWMECLSILGELQTSLKSLASVTTTLSHLETGDIRHQRRLVEEACRYLQLNFECIQKHCFEIYQSALVWIPTDSLIRAVYAADIERGIPRIMLGLPNSWSANEIIMGNTSPVNSVAFSQDGSRVIAGSDDKTVRIWDATSGEMQVELNGHTDWVNSVAFSQDGSRVVSGSEDATARIWDATSGRIQVELNGHTDSVNSVTFSQDGSRVVSGSHDETVRIWDAISGEMQVMGGSSLKLAPLTVHTPHISKDSQWICHTDRDCWIPPDYRQPCSMAFFEDRLCFGYSTGRVIILDMAPTR
ncbi:hypothetical protein B0H13DRAFT_1736937 [Mycena leptocephala]|nr:hypothetical protein B0H13DRAFT_1736937 [Mycena leptocephala]